MEMCVPVTIQRAQVEAKTNHIWIAFWVLHIRLLLFVGYKPTLQFSIILVKNKYISYAKKVMLEYL